MVGNRQWMALLLGLILSLLAPSQVRARSIEAKVDRNQVSLNESFTLVFESDDSVDYEPDFSPIEKNFEIIRRSQGSRMQIINGNISQKKQWTLTLMGREAGFFTIPPIFFGNDRSPRLRIDIKKTSVSQPQRSESLFLEVNASPRSAYVQSQFIYTVRLYRAVDLLSGNISEPGLSDADAVIEKLGEDREFETMRSGRTYKVVERRYAIFPQQSGRLTVSPITFAGQLASRSRSMFSPFPGGGAIKRLRSDPVEIEVKPVPQDKVRGQWLPARNLRLIEVWPEASKGSALSKVGEPVTWTLTLMAEGLTAAQLPEINAKIPDGFKSYPDQPILNNEKRSKGIMGFRQEKIALIPSEAGSYLLPAVEVPWWNTVTEKMEIARIPERLIEVAPAEAATRALPSSPIQEEAGEERSALSEIPAQTRQVASSFWSWVSLILALGWGITIVTWWGSRQPDSRAKGLQPPLPDVGPIKRQLKKTCLKNEAVAVKEALLIWTRTQWPGESISLGEIGRRVGDPLASEIAKLNATLYSRESEPWQDGPKLWEAFDQALAGMKRKSIQKREVLSPMYP